MSQLHDLQLLFAFVIISHTSIYAKKRAGNCVTAETAKILSHKSYN